MNDPAVRTSPDGLQIHENREVSQFLQELLRIGRGKQPAQGFKALGTGSRMCEESVDFVVAKDGSSSDAAPEAKNLK